jgi:hypothetical protein
VHVMLACDNWCKHYTKCVFLQVVQVVLICKVRSNEVTVERPSMETFRKDRHQVFQDLGKPCKQRLVHNIIYRAGIRDTKAA